MITADQEEFPWRRFAKEYNAFVEPRVPHHAKRFGVRYWEYKVVLTLANFMPWDVVVDVGGGHCFFMVYLSQFVKQTYVVDAGTFAGYDEWLEAMSQLEEVQSGKTGVIRSDAADTPLPDGCCDVAVSISAIEHFSSGANHEPDKDGAAVREIWRILKPGGMFVGTVDFNPQTEHPIVGSHDYTYTWRSFNERILDAAPFRLAGDIAKVPDDLAQYPASNNEIALCFALRKSPE